MSLGWYWLLEYGHESSTIGQHEVLSTADQLELAEHVRLVEMCFHLKTAVIFDPDQRLSTPT